MNYWNNRVVREQLDKRLVFLRDFVSAGMPKQGWIKTIRESLGLSARQLGKKAGLHQSRISRLEKGEKDGSLKLASLQNIARSLNMKFVYGFVPEESLEDMVKTQAKKVALKRMERLNDTMSLEKQNLSSEDQKKAMEVIIEKILIDQPKNFWD